MVDVAHQEEKCFEVVSLNAAKWLVTATFKGAPSMKMATGSTQGTELQPMSNDSIEITLRLVTSCEE